MENKFINREVALKSKVFVFVFIFTTLFNWKFANCYFTNDRSTHSCLRGNADCEFYDGQNKNRNLSAINTTGKYTVRIGGLFEIESSRRQYAFSEYAAALVALKHINENKIVDGVEINLVLNDTKQTTSGLKHLDRTTENDSCLNCNSPRLIRIGGLYDIGGDRPDWMGYSELMASRIAVKHFNNISATFKIELLVNDSKCDAGVATDVLLDLIYRKSQVLMVMGGACSDVTETLAELVPYWNLILVSYASTSPALSERKNYKTFFRLATTDSSNNPARHLFIEHFKWDTVATIYENKEMYYLAIYGLAETLEKQKIMIKRSVSFNAKVTEISSKIQELQKADARVIIAGFSEEAARQVFCQAYKHGMYGSRYVWILIKDFVDRWWEVANDTDCTVDQLQEATEGYFIVSSLNALDNNQMSVSNITIGKFLEDYRMINGTIPLSPYALNAYDTVWTMALTIGETIRRWNEDNTTYNISQFDYDDGEPMMKDIRGVMQNLSFDGLSGPVSFRGPDRRGISVVSQNQDGMMTTVAMYDPENMILNFNCSKCGDVVWKGEKIPRDKVLYIIRQRGIENSVFFIIVFVSLAGIFASIFFLWFNYHYRKLRYIKLSSPRLNNLAVFGCILVYGGVLLLGLDDTRFKQKNYPIFCTVRSFMFAAGFSLSFGSMFTKTYRVHQIFTRAHSGLIKSKLLQDKQLMIIISALLCVDSAMMVLWVCVDPMKRQIYNITTEPSPEDQDIIYIYQSSSCHSVHMDKWLGSFYAFKGLLLIFGVYMAWETRNVKIPALNDSQYIGMNVYNVVTMTITVVVMSNILSKSPTLSYVVESTILLLSTTLTLCLLFVPKIYCILTAKGEPVIASSGILVEDKTRRFIVNDKREIYYRAEVQNRVYKREIIELEQEISRLERLLELPVEPYPKMTAELMKMLPETRIDSFSPTPDIMRRIRRRSIVVNDEEVSIDGFGSDSSESSSSDSDTIASGNAVSAKPFTNRKTPLRMSIKNAAASTARRLSLWRKAITEKHNREKSTSNNIQFQQKNQLTLGIKPKTTNLELNSHISSDLQVSGIRSQEGTHHLECINPKTRWRIMLTPESESEDIIEITSISPDVSMETCVTDDAESKIVPSKSNLLKSDITTHDIDKKDELLSFLLLNERRKRIHKLQTDIKHIHQQLVNLEELEYVVSNV